MGRELVAVADMVGLVRAEGAHPAKALGTVAALVRHFAGVDALVDAQVVAAGVVLVADLAAVGGGCGGAAPARRAGLGRRVVRRGGRGRLGGASLLGLLAVARVWHDAGWPDGLRQQALEGGFGVEAAARREGGVGEGLRLRGIGIGLALGGLVQGWFCPGAMGGRTAF